MYICKISHVANIRCVKVESTLASGVSDGMPILGVNIPGAELNSQELLQ